MKDKVPSFLEFVEDVFYTFSQIKPGSINVQFSKSTQFPIIKFDSELEIVIPLPRKQDEKYVFEGMVFDNDDTGRKNMWCMFLTTIYHLASHVCVSRYSVYDEWRKNKTKDVCLHVIDFIEDVSVERYISHTSPEIFENIKNIDSKFIQQTKVTSPPRSMPNLKIYGFDNDEKIKNMRTNLLNNRDDVLSSADFLYNSRELLLRYNRPYCELHDSIQLLRTEEKSPNFEPFGIFKENIEKLDALWQIDVQLKSKLLRTYGKYLKDLNFDSTVIPQGNFYNFTQLKEKASPMLRRIRQQIRMVANLVDEPQIDQIGYLNMQLAIQAIA